MRRRPREAVRSAWKQTKPSSLRLELAQAMCFQLSLEVTLPHSHVLLYIPHTAVINLEEPEV